jgi:hypothetical protein
MHDLVKRLDAKPELRLVPYSFQRAYGHPPDTVWTAPYAVRLADPTVAVPVQWQVVVAASPRTDRTVRMASLNRPAEWVETHLDEMVELPTWARSSYQALTSGADLLVHADLPPVTGLSADLPLACATALALGGTLPTAEPTLLRAILEGAPPPRDRLMLIVTRGQGTTIAIDAALKVAASAWPHGPAVIAHLPAPLRPALRADVIAAFRDHDLRPPRFLNLTVARPARREA